MRSFGLETRYSLYAVVAMMAESEPVGVIELEENLGDAEKPPEIPGGLYSAEVQDVQTPTSGKGNQYFAVTFVIASDDLPADVREDYPDGAKLFWNRVIVPKGRDRRALFNLRKFVESLGLDSNTTSIDPNEWMGRKARIRVVHGTYQGETRAEIKSVEAGEDEAPAPKPPTVKSAGGRSPRARR